jgi:hypothetical protein
MQLMPRYLFKNKIDLIADVAGFITEYRPVYRRQLNVYRGIDNTLDFRLLNADQKPINLANYTPILQVFDENKNLIIEHECTVLDDGSTVTKGLFKVVIAENDLLNVSSQFVNYVVYLKDNNDNRIITYTDTHFGMEGIMKVSSDAFPGAKSSKQVSQFHKPNNTSTFWISETLEADPAINNNEGLHTVAVYTSNYSGIVTVQATLSNQINNGTDWADVTDIVFIGNETAPVPANFNGVFSHLRFKTNSNPTNKISKILVRN